MAQPDAVRNEFHLAEEEEAPEDEVGVRSIIQLRCFCECPEVLPVDSWSAAESSLLAGRCFDFVRACKMPRRGAAHLNYSWRYAKLHCYCLREGKERDRTGGTVLDVTDWCMLVRSRACLRACVRARACVHVCVYVCVCVWHALSHAAWESRAL